MHRIAPLAALLVVATAACVTAPTEVMISLDSDAPLGQPLILRATARASSALVPAGTPPDHEWTRGIGTGSLTLPASFTVVPATDAPRDEQISLFIEAVSGDRAVRRFARFRFVQHQTQSLRVFLAFDCAATATGCAHTTPCTVQALCEEQGQTCGDQARCVSVDVPLMPGGLDGGADVTVPMPDVPAVDAPIVDTSMIDASMNDVPVTDVPVTDVLVSDVPIAPDSGPVCVGTCGAMGSFTNVGPRPSPDPMRRIVDEELSAVASTCAGTRCITGGITP